MVTRRQFNKGLVGVAFSGLFAHLQVAKAMAGTLSLGSDKGFGPLIADPQGVLDLPVGFAYRVISTLGQSMADGLTVPDRADGMGCFELDEHRVVLVRNHELSPRHAFGNSPHPPKALSEKAYDVNASGFPLPGGTSTIVYNLATNQVEREYMSLLGTIRNCAGGTTPWNTWLTCEETVATASAEIGKDHGYVFEVPISNEGLTDPVPLTAMGRFNHEAVCVDPDTGILYMTEDRSDSLFYRFIPNTPGNLRDGGQLQALALIDKPQFDTRNWQQQSMPLGQSYACQWLNLDNVESPNDDLRLRGHQQGAALFARGEGLHFGDNEMYFCCTSGGNKKLGQIMRYRPSPVEGQSGELEQPGQLDLFVESPNKATFNYGDNLTISTAGHLVVCEDQYSDEVNNHLRGVTPDGKVYDLAKVRLPTEPAGACFSPDGSTLFVNLYSPTMTLAISGPWDSFVT